MGIKNLSAKEKQWVFVTIFVAVGAAGYVWVIEPLLDSSSGVGQKLESKKNAFKKDLKNLAQYEALHADRERLTQNVPALGGKEDITGSLGHLEKIAGDCSVTITSIKPQIVEEEDGTQRNLFDISARAGSLGLTRFLYRLETSTSLLRVKRLSVTSNSQGPEDLQCALLVSQLVVG